MTSYQNVAESQISGYNDCPLDLSSYTSSSSGPKQRRQRLQHNLSSSSLVSNSSNSSLSSTTYLSAPPKGPTPARSFSGNGAPPQISMGPPPPQTTTNSQLVANTDSESEDISDEKLLEQINVLLSYDSTLPEREFEHYGRKLRDAAPKMKQQHRALIVSSVKNYTSKEEVKKSIVHFMMTNDGTSIWCVPLRKLLENVKH